MAKKGGSMRMMRLAAIGVLALGASSYAALTNMKTGISAQTSLLDNDSYRPAMGVNGFIGTERGTTYGAAGMGLRANFDNYRIEGDEVGKDIQEGGVALTAMGGPNVAHFQPRVGGHVGYARMEEGNYLDLGPDVSASVLVTPTVGLQALVTPTWFINQDKTDYLGTKMGLGVTWSLPGA
jgi:hypothetical protein